MVCVLVGVAQCATVEWGEQSMSRVPEGFCWTACKKCDLGWMQCGSLVGASMAQHYRFII